MRPVSASGSGRSVGLHLSAFAVAIVVPILVFAIVLLREWEDGARHSSEQNATAIVRALTDDVEREILDSLVTLQVLSHVRTFQARDWRGFHGTAQSIFAGQNRAVLVIDPSLQQLVNTRVPFGTPLGLTGDLESARIVLATKQPYVSDLFFGQVARQHVVDVLWPVIESDSVAFILLMTIDRARLGEILRRLTLPPGWLAGISDRKDLIIARSDSQERFTAQPLSEEIRRKSTARAGVIHAVDLEGRESLRAYQLSDITGWRIAAWVPVAVVEAPIHQSRRILLAVGAGLIALSALSAALIGGRIARAIRQLATMATEPTQAPAASDVREVNEVAAVLAAGRIERARQDAALREQAERLEIAESASEGYVFDQDVARGTVWRSEGVERLLGYTREELGSGMELFRALLNPEDRAWYVDTQRRIGTDGSYQCEFRIRRRDGEEMWLWERTRVLRDASGRPVRLVGSMVDITQRKRLTDELERATALLRAVIEAAPNVIYAKDRASRILLANPAFLACFNRKRDEIIGRVSTDWHHVPAQSRAIAENDRRVIAEGVAIEVEETVDTVAGPRVFLSHKVPLRDPAGAVIGLVGVSTDITAQKAHAEHIALLNRELVHRTKNLMAVILAISQRTAAKHADVDGFLTHFSGRLHALSHSLDLLVRKDWRGARLDELVTTQLAPFAEAPGQRVSIAGPVVMLRPEAAQHVGLAFHELATNAIKHGALTTPEGRIDVGWAFEPDESGLRVTWRERGGPVVEPPQSRGFGHAIIETTVAVAVGGSATLDFPPEGLQWTLTISSAHLMPASQADEFTGAPSAS